MFAEGMPKADVKIRLEAQKIDGERMHSGLFFRPSATGGKNALAETQWIL
jgi:hypothetical protein